MWKRYELKYRAKDMLKKCFWSAVVVCLISAFLSGEFSSGQSSNPVTIRNNYNTISNRTYDAFDGDVSFNSIESGIETLVYSGVAAFFIGIGVIILLVGMAVAIFIGAPIEIGSKRFFMCNREQEARIGMIGYGFQSGRTMRIVGIMLMRSIKTFLWSLLLVIPGIIKSYEYRMVPYILAENSEMEMSKVFYLSKSMMMGNKWDAFVLDLSFILWMMLGGITCGLANIFYVNPYIAATNAELYAVLREDIIRRGVANSYELPGFTANPVEVVQ